MREEMVLLAQWSRLFVKGVRNIEFVDPAAPEFRRYQNFPPVFPQRARLSKLRLGFPSSGRGWTAPSNSVLDIEEHCLPGTAQKQSLPSQRAR